MSDLRLGDKLPEREQAVVDAIAEAFPGATEIEEPRPEGRVIDRAEGAGIVVDLVGFVELRDVTGETSADSRSGPGRAP